MGGKRETDRLGGSGDEITRHPGLPGDRSASSERPPLTPMQEKVVEVLRRELGTREGEVSEVSEVSGGTPSTAAGAAAPPHATEAGAAPLTAPVVPTKFATKFPTTGAEMAPLTASAGEVGAQPREEELLQARKLNEFVYCPRLFYYEHVEGVFVENADTLRGSAIHKRVDSGTGAMPRPAANDQWPKLNDQTISQNPNDKGETIHSRSVSMGSERLGVVAKMDLVEVRWSEAAMEGSSGETPDSAGGTPALSSDRTGDLFALEVCPVDYKAGAPKEGAEANELWDTDKMQLGLQALILRENGYPCNEGIIYYRATKQRVRLAITAELISWIEAQVSEARRVASGPIPGPLVNSPKCIRCSLAPVCLPDETRLLGSARVTPAVEGFAPETTVPSLEPSRCSDKTDPPRRIIAARDDARALYLSTPGLRVGITGETLQVKEKEKLIDQVRIRDLNHVALFGNIQISTQAVQTLCEQEVPITYFSMGGWFYGITRGHELKNVFLRKEQFKASDNSSRSLEVARQIVSGKIRNHRTLLRRLHVELPEVPYRRLKVLAENAAGATSLQELLGIEGAAASVYFENFNGMIKVDDDLAGGNGSDRSGQMRFSFENRTRRPPTDPVNALLSLGYSMLAKDATIAACAVGFDPYIGFYHQPRFGRPALALDLMEEFRPLIAESAVLSALNNRVITPGDFVRAGKCVNLTAAGRKKFVQTYERRISEDLVTHPIFEYKVSYRRALELQARILAKWLTNETAEYVPFTTR